MTLEGEGPAEDQTPAPPARTRWSEDASDDADVLLPPYVPGRAAPEPSARAGQPAPDARAEEAPAAPAAEDAAAADPWAEPAEPGDFAAPEPEPVAGTVEPERSASVEPEQPAAEAAPGEYPWDAAGDDRFEPASEPEAESHEPAEPWGVGGPEFEDEFPFGAFDLEGSGEQAAAEELPGVDEPFDEPFDEPYDEPLDEPYDEPFTSGGGSSRVAAGTDAMAERMEQLAEALRREGRPGVERAMGSEDRLTSLLASVLAGYLAGREG